MTEFEKLCIIPSDINEHLPTLLKYAKECSHITEFGVRDIVSTWAWVESKAPTVVCYDIVEPPKNRLLAISEYAENNKVNFTFKLASSLEETIEETDLLFIDTLHIYDQLIQELRLHHTKVRKYIIMHDTELFGTIGIGLHDVLGVGLNQAIDEFLENNLDWKVKEIFKNNNGLTILERTNS